MSSPTNLQDLQELKNRLLEGLRTVKPHATQCLEGTRTSILADVDIKTNNHDGPNIIHIYGAPGSGKSSISLTTKSRLQRQRRLVTYFRFDRNEAATTTPTSLWCHVAYGLARLFPSVLSQLLQQLQNDEINFDSPIDIFTSCIEEALLNITHPIDRPLVVIIDALDECGGLAGRLSSDRQILLQTLARWARLPKHFKLLVTSRPEGNITQVLSSISIPIEIPSGHSVTENPEAKSSLDSSNDIRMFLEGRFQSIRQSLSLPAEWPGSVIISAMVDRAAGVFMWATTATNFIDSGIDPRGRLQKIMDDASDPSSMEPLYSLYSLVLEVAFGKMGSGGVEAEILQFVLGTMVLAKRPLDDIEYTKLPTTEPITQEMIGSIRDRLRSVIPPDSLRFVHKSFDDFLLSEKCPLEYRINQGDTHYLLTDLCLKTMMEGLHFNICGLETSCLNNVDVPDIATKVARGISPLLSYSCMFFADHLGLAPFDEHLMEPVREMILDKLLFWFEAMSLLKEINRVSRSLLLILKWLHISSNDEFKDFIHDARRFIGSFGHPIAQSAPQIYISALSFAPKNSSVAKHFLPHFLWIPVLSTGKPANWPSCIFTSEYHSDAVNCVSFSADEEYFVTGSGDNTICVFDSDTGNLISGPFNCDESVYSVCFDPNGCQVWTGCRRGKVICWDIRTGNRRLVVDAQAWYGPPVSFNCRLTGSRKIIYGGETISLWDRETGRCEQNYDWERGANLISPDGCYLAQATGEYGRSIRIWKVVNGSKIQGPMDSDPQLEHWQPIFALSFSVDSKFAVSGSEDGTVLIWDASTGDAVGPLLSTGDGEVSAVAYSPNKHLLVSTSSVVTIWNALTHKLLGRLEGHTSTVVDIAMSRDGQRALTASLDRTVRMWDLGRRDGVLTTDANQTHTSEVWDVAFSPCGRKLVSLDSCSIRVWDTNSGNHLFKYDTWRKYEKLIFSPDGIHVVAYADQSGGFGVWNANTGALVSQFREYLQVDHVAFRSTDGVLVVCSGNGFVQTWSIGKRVSQKVAKLPSIVALSPDGLTAVVRDDQRSPRHYVWSTTTHQHLPLVFADDEHVSPPMSVYLASTTTYSPSGQYFASFHNFNQGGCMLRAWDMLTGGLVACFSTDNNVNCLAFSPDDRHITSSIGGQIRVLDTCTGQLTSGPWSGHTDKISTLVFSLDGELLVSGSGDRQVRVWNVASMLGELQLSPSNWGVGFHMEDGWLRDVDGKLLFWVPKDHRSRLVWPHSVPVGESKTRTELDLSTFIYGENWAKCYSGGDSSRHETTRLSRQLQDAQNQSSQSPVSSQAQESGEQKLNSDLHNTPAAIEEQKIAIGRLQQSVGEQSNEEPPPSLFVSVMKDGARHERSCSSPTTTPSIPVEPGPYHRTTISLEAPPQQTSTSKSSPTSSLGEGPKVLKDQEQAFQAGSTNSESEGSQTGIRRQVEDLKRLRQQTEAHIVYGIGHAVFGSLWERVCGLSADI